ncbi:flagellar basal body-associated FliL family protein [Roseibium sp.]|uniref:flagellar basal body-associated FliL family protein n=1 Tax=Roseibium sp. TaxID=1936156 RepID=UPI003A96B57E
MARLLAGPTASRTRVDPDSRASFWFSFLILTLISAATGAFFAVHVSDFARTQVEHEFGVASSRSAPEPIYLQNARLRSLQPLVTNLAAPRDAWVRVQASIILADDPIDDVAVLTGHIEEDILAYLRTLTISHIEGAVGLQHLREDLNERAIARSGGTVREVILESLVIQ